MNEDLLDYWLRIIKPLLPTNAWIAPQLADGDYIIKIDWNLKNDPDQLNKRSRKIEIIITEEVIDDYLNKNHAERASSDIKMKQWISERYNHFTFDHGADTSYSKSPDNWRTSKDVLS